MRKLLLVLLWPVMVWGQSKPDTIRWLNGQPISPVWMNLRLAQLVDSVGVKGLSVALVQNGRIVYSRGFGLTGNGPQVVDTQTVFMAASFSKAVFASLFMRMLQRQTFNLDLPLHLYLSKPLPEYPSYKDLGTDERWLRITARHVLSHTTGFPNWRSIAGGGALRFYSDPGATFQYSGEAFQLLQMVVEETTHTGLDTLAREQVFAPLGMRSSSYRWREDWRKRFALPHGLSNKQLAHRPYGRALAAASMLSTPNDMGRWLIALMGGRGQWVGVLPMMMEPNIQIESRRMFGPESGKPGNWGQSHLLAWGLGVGLFSAEVGGSAFFHLGREAGQVNLFVAYPGKQTGVVIMANSDRIERSMHVFLDALLGPGHKVPDEWLGYRGD